MILTSPGRSPIASPGERASFLNNIQSEASHAHQQRKSQGSLCRRKPGQPEIPCVCRPGRARRFPEHRETVPHHGRSRAHSCRGAHQGARRSGLDRRQPRGRHCRRDLRIHEHVPAHARNRRGRRTQGTADVRLRRRSRSRARQALPGGTRCRPGWKRPRRNASSTCARSAATSSSGIRQTSARSAGREAPGSCRSRGELRQAGGWRLEAGGRITLQSTPPDSQTPARRGSAWSNLVAVRPKGVRSAAGLPADRIPA